MWWIFEKMEDSNERILYSYARESKDLTGLVEYRKDEEEVLMIRPCSSDEDSTWCQEKALGKFAAYVVDEGFPQTRKVVTG